MIPVMRKALKTIKPRKILKLALLIEAARMARLFKMKMKRKRGPNN
jgi:hypothetical protein